MKFLTTEKGTYRYINRQRIIEIFKTIILFSFAIGLYLIGYLTLKTNKSLWTIFAVLSVLPAAKSAVIMIMFLRFSSISNDDYSAIEESRGSVPLKYEYAFTTREKSYFVKSAACYDNTVIVLMDDKYNKGKNKNLAANELKEHLKMSIEREGLKDYSLKIYTDLKGYCKRLDEMNANLNPQEDSSSAYVFALFNAISI